LYLLRKFCHLQYFPEMFVAPITRPHRSSLSYYYVEIYRKVALHTGYKVSQGRPYLVGCSQLQTFVRPVHAGWQGDVRPIRRKPMSVTQVGQLRSSRQRWVHQANLVYRWTENCACLLHVPHSYHIACSCPANSSVMFSRCQHTKYQPTGRLHPVMSAWFSAVSD